ncbi:MAG TPA: methyltransferase domain-containing protein [Gaiellales bacterium]|jgi:ubiquinone/menaquinone biosynthesis C-methylase UbiE|nr:methyltransferase domain-containing protein [Gaiellales bacterium]
MAAAEQPDELEPFDFEAGARYWDTLYDSSGFDSLAYYRPRLERALAWVDSLCLPVGAQVLEIGFGAGRTALALAQRGLIVTGIERGERMLQLATARIARYGLAGRVELRSGDAHAIEAPDGTFDLVLALGVLPWVEQPGACVREMGRVTRPGGHVIGSVANRRQLNRVLDPRLSPVVQPAKQLAQRALRRGPREPRPNVSMPTHHSRRQYEQWLGAAGLQPVRSATLGFGRFSLIGRPIVSEPRSIRVHQRLQARADAGFPGLRSSGAQLLVLSRKPR